MKEKVINVVAAVMKEGNKYLCMQRCRKGPDYVSEKWEFPGGKIEGGENSYEALLREIKEELDWDIFVGRQIGMIEHQYPDYTVCIHAYWCKPGEGQLKLLNHLDYQWLEKSEFDRLKWAAADQKIIDLLP